MSKKPQYKSSFGQMIWIGALQQYRLLQKMNHTAPQHLQLSDKEYKLGKRMKIDIKIGYYITASCDHFSCHIGLGRILATRLAI